VRWARLSERAHLPAAGLSIDTRAVLLPDEGDRADGSSPSIADLSPSFSSMSATLAGVPGVVWPSRRRPLTAVCHKPAVSSAQTGKHWTTPRNVDHAEKTSAGAWLLYQDPPRSLQDIASSGVDCTSRG